MDISRLAYTVWQWADSAFPERTDASMFLKMYGEIGELVESPDSDDELADIFIMLLDYGVRKNINIEDAVLKKLDINRNREWHRTASGVMRHIK